MADKIKCQCALCGIWRFEEDVVFIENYTSNGFVSILNDYICRDKCSKFIYKRGTN